MDFQPPQCFNIVCIIISILICDVSLVSQRTIQPEILSVKDGLSNVQITNIFQDSDGFMWFGTKKGLNRYDGHSFMSFQTDITDPYAISDDDIGGIEEYGEYLIISTSDEDLNFFHKKTERFYSLKKAMQTDSLGFTYLDLIKKDVNGQVWGIDQASRHLIRFSFDKNFSHQLIKSENTKNAIKISRLNHHNLRTGSYWLEDTMVFASNGKARFWKSSINELKATEVYVDTSLHDEHVYNNHMFGKNKALFMMEVGAHHQIREWKNNEWQIENIEDHEFDPYYSSIYPDWLIMIAFSRKDYAYFFERSRKNISDLSFENASFKIRKDDIRINRFKTDASGNIWIGTDKLGIQKVNTRVKDISLNHEDRSVSQIIYVFEDGSSIILNSVSSISYTEKEVSNPEQLALKQFLKDAIDAKIWDGVQDTKWMYKQIHKNNIYSSHLYQSMNNQPNNITQLIELDFIPRVFHQDTTSKLVGIAGNQNVLFYHPNSKESKKITVCDSKDKIYSIAKTENDHWWIGSSAGLFELSPTERTGPIPEFKIKNHEVNKQLIKQNQREGLINNDILSLLTDPTDANILWIGTNGGGLHSLDTRSMNFSYLTKKDGLASNIINGILSDNENSLWMSSNRGIIRYYPISGVIKSYRKPDGLQGDVFNKFAYGKTLDGKLAFGGTNGLNIFHPDVFRDNPVAPKVRLTQLTVNNQIIEIDDSTNILDESISYIESISLPYSKNSVTLEFAALEFTTPSKNRFKYYLEGIEKKWQHESARNDAQYLNLAPGNYTFKIKAANGDGVWSSDITELDITILPPWYRTNIAFISYLLLFGILLWTFRNYEKKRLLLSHAAEVERQEANRLKELDQIKSKLYTNITHEFRTPLTVISGIASQLDSNDDKKELILRNSDQLLNLVNQMLDLRKIETGSIAIHKQQADIVRYLRYLTESFKGLAASQGLTVHFITDEEKILMDFDADKITRIHSNLLSNAIKFTPEGGNIYIQLSVENQHLIYIVKDTGIGIAKEKLASIFDRFYQVDDSSTRKSEGTGIGLTLVSELINAMQGEIQVKSKEGNGSTFKVKLAISNTADLADEESLTNVVKPILFVGSTAIQADQKYGTEVAGQSDRPTVLIVEDNADVIHYLMSCLKQAYIIEIAMNGQAGIDKAREGIPDLIISDVMMPIKDGLELCDTLKTDVRTSHIPIILLTAKADIESRLLGLKRGADAYLGKPFHHEELLQILKNQLSLRIKIQHHLVQFSDRTDPNATGLQKAKDDSILKQLEMEDAFLQKIRLLVEKDLTENEINMTKLIRSLKMSRSQIYKKVKALTGLSPSLYIRSVRLFHAKQLLELTELNVSEVAYEVGFTSPTYFSDVFFEEYDLRPNEVRKRTN